MKKYLKNFQWNWHEMKLGTAAKGWREIIHKISYEKLKTWNLLSVSISPIFYKQLFHTKHFCAAFMCLQFGFDIFWQKDFGAKAAHKMLVKLTLDVPYLVKS